MSDEGDSIYEVQFINERGEKERVPLHECDIVKGNVKVASFRQDGWFTTRRFRADWSAYLTEADDLGQA